MLAAQDDGLVAMLVDEMLLGHRRASTGPVIARREARLELTEHDDIYLAFLDVNLGGTESFPIADLLRGTTSTDQLMARTI